MNKLIGFGLLIVFASCQQNSQPLDKYVLPQIGERDPRPNKYPLNYLLVTSGGSIKQAYQYTYEGIVYKYCVDENDKLDFLSTSDTNFVSDGMRVGDKYSMVKAGIPDSAIKIQFGWATYVALKSGWNAVFNNGSAHTARTISDTERVQFFFKRGAS